MVTSTKIKKTMTIEKVMKLYNVESAEQLATMLEQRLTYQRALMDIRVITNLYKA